MSYSETARAIALTVSHVWTSEAVTAWLTTGDKAYAAAAASDACDADEAYGESPEGFAALAALATIPSRGHGGLSAIDYSTVAIVRGLVADALRS